MFWSYDDDAISIMQISRNLLDVYCWSCCQYSVNVAIPEAEREELNDHLEETLKEVALLSYKKASQASDIPVKII